MRSRTAVEKSSSAKKARVTVDVTDRNKDHLKENPHLNPIVEQLLIGFPVEVKVSDTRKDVTIILRCGDGRFCIDKISKMKIYNGTTIKSKANKLDWIGEIMVDHNGKPWFRFAHAIFFDSHWMKDLDESKQGVWTSTPASAYKDAYWKMTEQIVSGSENVRLILGIFYEPMQLIFEAYYARIAADSQLLLEEAPVEPKEIEANVDADIVGRNVAALFAHIAPVHPGLLLAHYNQIHEEDPIQLAEIQPEVIDPMIELIDIKPTEIKHENDWNTIQQIDECFPNVLPADSEPVLAHHQNHLDDDYLL